MFKNIVKFAMILWLFCISAVVCAKDDFKLDTGRYIPLDEVKPGMEAYCLTAYEGTKVEKFELEVLSVVRNIDPSRDAILVMGKDERFIHTGPVAGCSGSPVYIDGRLAGALSFGWALSKDPLYGVTPIEEMIRPTSGESISSTPMSYTFDFSKPIDFSFVEGYANTSVLNNSDASSNRLPCVLLSSGMPQSAFERFGKWANSKGLFLAPSGAVFSDDKNEVVKIEPGSPLAVPLVNGDIEISVVGTVTEVVGDDVYAFGHSFLGYGAVDLPMAGAKVHTVVSSIMRSFKLASALNIVGALKFDEATVVRGKIGQQAKMIPLKVTVQRYNDPLQRVYNCQVADNRILTPLLVRMVLAGAALQYGDLPPDHSVKYKSKIEFNGSQSLSFENISTDSDIRELLTENMSPLVLLMNNPFRHAKIKSISCDIQEYDKSLDSRIWSLNLSDSRVRPGQTVTIETVIESHLGDRKDYSFEIEIPQDLKSDKYELIVCGGYGYLDFLRAAAEHKFIAEDIRSLTEALDMILSIRRDRLYCILMLPKRGITLSRAELPDLPATKSLVLIDPKRSQNASSYQHWIEKSILTDTVVSDIRKLEITVEE